MHPALDRDVGVCDARRKQLAQRAQVKGILWRNPPPLLQILLHLLKHRVLQDGVDDQHKSRHDARPQAQRPLVAQQREKRAERGGRFRRRTAGQGRLVGLRLASRHARVDNPDGVCDEHGCAAGEGAREHRLDGGELHRRAAGLDCGLFEEGAGPFVPFACRQYKAGRDADMDETVQ